MAITEQEKVRARHHLGFTGVGSAATFLLGIPAATQPQFMVEGAWNKILPQSETKFRELLDRLDAVEQQIEDDMDTLVVSKIGDIDLRPDEFQQLIVRYKYWQGALSNLLLIPPNPFDARGWLSGSAVNVAVNNG